VLTIADREEPSFNHPPAPFHVKLRKLADELNIVDAA
jgi:hypothetical protein